MSRLRSFILIILLLFALHPVAHAGGIGPAAPQEFTGTAVLTSCSEGETIYADFFYGEGCSHCNRVRPAIDDLVERYPQVHVNYREVYLNATDREMFWEVLDRYGIEFEAIPLFTIGNTVLAGEDDIRAGLESYVPGAAGDDSNLPVFSPSLVKLMEDARKNEERRLEYRADLYNSSSPTRAEVTLASVLVAAAVDSINPCAIAVLAVLLAYLTTRNDRKELLLIGFTYIGAVFAVYFFAGLGLLTVVQMSGISGIVFTLAGVIAVAAGMINIGEALLKDRKFSLSIPDSQKERINRYIRQVSIPSAVILGGLVSVVELPCTGGVYLAILSLLGNRMTFAEGLPYLILYNLVFVLPLVFILFIVCYGISPDRIDAWRAGMGRWVRFAMGSVMLGLGGAMLLGFL